MPIYKLMKRRNLPTRKQYYKYTFNKYAFDDLNDEQTCYWWGFIYADGYIANGITLRICLHSKDTKHLYKIKEFLKSNYPIRKYKSEGMCFGKYRKRAVCLLMVHRPYCGNRLINLGVVKDRNQLGRLTSQLPNNQFNHWLRGYFDGDGCAKERETVEFSGQPDLLKWIAIQLHINAGTSNNKNLGSYNHTSKVKALAYGGARNVRKVTDYLYKDATVWLERKKKIIDAWPPLKQKRE